MRTNHGPDIAARCRNAGERTLRRVRLVRCGRTVTTTRKDSDMEYDEEFGININDEYLMDKIIWKED